MKKLFLLSFMFVFVFACTKPADKKMDSTTMDSENMSTEMNAQSNDKSVSAEIVMLMHMPMMAAPYSETMNPDVDFLVNMTPHHQGAIDSSTKMLEVGKSKEVMELSKNIIAAQEMEIAQFEKVIEELKVKADDYSAVDLKKYNMEATTIMNDMMKNMSALELTGNADIDMLDSMIIHHQGAIDSSNKILEITKNQTIMDIAKKIVMDQEKEIAEMTELSKKLKKENGI